jgi:hypothetical protein
VTEVIVTDDIAVVDIAAAHHPQWVHRTHVDLLAGADEMLNDTNPPDGLPYESTNCQSQPTDSEIKEKQKDIQYNFLFI